MTARQIIVPGAMPSRDRNGRALAGKLRFYAPGTTTPKTVYTSNALSVAHPFPILSDSAGQWPSIWADDAQSFDVAWSDQTFDKTVATYSNVSPANDAVLASTALAQASADAAAASAATAAANATSDTAVAAAASATAAASSATAASGSATAAAGSATSASGSATAAAGSASAAATSAANAAAIVGFDPTVRTISAAGLATGGGTLAANRTITVTKSTQAQAQAGTDDTTAMTPLRVADAITAQAINVIPVAPSVIMRASTGVAPTAATWTDCTLNTTDRNQGSLATLASNKVTLPAGTYYAKAKVPLKATSSSNSTSSTAAPNVRLFNSTDAAVIGSAGDAVTVAWDQTDTVGSGATAEVVVVFTLAATKDVKLQVFFSGTVLVTTTSAFIEIWKIG